MDEKDGEQVDPEKAQWFLAGNTVAAFVGMLAPAAFFTICLGRSGVFWDFLWNADYSKFRALGYNTRARHRLLLWIRNNVLMILSYGPSLGLHDLWRDGSILCSLINLLVPEACAHPQNHCGKRPAHGQALALKYLGIPPIFTDEELTQQSLTSQQEQRFFKYLSTLHQIFVRNSRKNMKFSTDYVSRGMGLVVAQQYQKSVFYIYPIPRRFYCQHPCDLEVLIKGPYGSVGHIVIPSILHQRQLCQESTDYRRSLYMTSKLNSISPTTQGTSFFRILSLRKSPKAVDSSREIVIKVKVTESRAKVSYVPQQTGVHEVSLVTNGHHVVESPYTVPVEPSTEKTCLSNDSDSDSDEERHERFVRRKKRIISRIVDFGDEKMLLQNDGTLVEINNAKPTKSVEDTSFKDNQLDKGSINKTVNAIEDELFVDNPVSPNNTEKLEIQTGDRFLENNQMAKENFEKLEEKESLSNDQNFERMRNEKEFNSADKLLYDEEMEGKRINNNTKEEPIEDTEKTFECNDDAMMNNSLSNNIMSQPHEVITDKSQKYGQDILVASQQNNEENMSIYQEEISENDEDSGTDTDGNFVMIQNSSSDTESESSLSEIFNTSQVNLVFGEESKDCEEVMRDMKLLEATHKQILDPKVNDSLGKENIFLIENHFHEVNYKDNILGDPQNVEDDTVQNSMDTNQNVNITLTPEMDINYNTTTLKNNNIHEDFSSTTPDILEPSNNYSTTTSSETSTEFVSVLQNISDSDTKLFSRADPTSDSEVQDQNSTHGSSVYEIMKTFSTKDPSKEQSSIDNYVPWTIRRNYAVNNLRKVFDGADDASTTNTSSNRGDTPPKLSRQSNVLSRWQPANQNGRTFKSLDSLLQVGENQNQVIWRNDPDLVQFNGRHKENTRFSSAQYFEILNTSKPVENLQNTDTKLNRIGAVLTDYDKRQRYLKSVLVHHINSIPKGKLSNWCHKYRNETISEDISSPNFVLGVVERQKKFWQNKIKERRSLYSAEDVTKHSLWFSTNASKPVTTQAEVVNKVDPKLASLHVQRDCYDQGVSTETQRFDSKFSSSESVDRTTGITVIESSIHKSSSEGNIQNADCYRSPQILKIEESFHYPSIQERKALLLKVYSETTLCRGDTKSLVEQSPTKKDTQQEEPLSVPRTENKLQPEESGTRRVDKKSSFRRRARFERAKLFFHHLEGSQPKLSAKSNMENTSSNPFQVQRCESAPCLDRNMEYTNNNNGDEEEESNDSNSAQQLKISDRFLVDNLFHDILGDPDERFLGIPNKMAVVASLASFDGGSNNADFDSSNEGESQLDQLEKKETGNGSESGFHEDYPHPPTTERWQYKSRSNLDLAGLIPRRLLLGQSENELNV